MKTLFSMPFFMLLFCCNSKSNISQTRKDSIAMVRPDTIVGVHVVPAEIVGEDYIEKEYFVIVKSDTSSFSCIIKENKISNKISIHYRYDPYGKTPTSFSSEDTAAVAEHEPVKKFNHISTYDGQIRELKHILNYASKDYNLGKLSSVRLSILSVNGLSQSITKQYINQYGEKFPPGSNQKVASLIEKSQFGTDLNNILSPYLMIVNKASLDGLMYYVPQSAQKGTKPLLDGIVIFKLVPTH